MHMFTHTLMRMYFDNACVHGYACQYMYLRVPMYRYIYIHIYAVCMGLYMYV